MASNDLRCYALTKFVELFQMEMQAAMVMNAERGVYNFTVSDCKRRGIVCSWENPQFKSAYKHKLNGLLFNLKNPSNPKLLQHVLNKEIETKHIAFLRPDELDPELWVEINKKVAQRFPTNTDLEVPDSPLLKCTKCGSRKVTYYSLQTRR